MLLYVRLKDEQRCRSTPLRDQREQSQTIRLSGQGRTIPTLHAWSKGRTDTTLTRRLRSRTKGLFTWKWGTPGRWGNPPSRGRKIKRVYKQSYNPGVLGWGFLRLLLRLQLGSLSRGVPSSHLEKDERLILGHICIYSWKRHALCYAVFGFARNRWLNTLYGIVWETKYGRFTTLNIPKCEHFTLLVCPLRFLVISAMRRLGNVQSFKTYVFRFWAFCHERDPG